MVIAQRAYNNLGAQCQIQGEDQVAAVGAFRRAGQLAQQRGVPQEEAFQLRNLAEACCMAGDLHSAGDVLERLHRLARAHPASERMKYVAMRAEASYLSYKGELEQATELFRAAAAHYETTQDPQILALVYRTLGMGHIDLGEFDEAERALKRAILLDDSRKGAGGSGVLPRAFLAIVYARQGRFAEAEALLAEAVKLAGPEPPGGSNSALQASQAWLALARSDWETAIALFQAVIERDRRARRHWLTAIVTLDLAEAYQRRAAPGDREYAQALLQETQAAFNAMGASGYAARTAARLKALDSAAPG
jgi:tetratricopeptide (TPR) repeat protein